MTLPFLLQVPPANNIPNLKLHTSLTSSSPSLFPEITIRPLPVKSHNDKKFSSISLICWNARSPPSKAKISFCSALTADFKLFQEAWHPQEASLNSLKPYTNQIRPNREGGGSLTMFHENFMLIRDYKLNEDSLLSRFTIHSSKSLWVGNIYVNKGRHDQLKAIFSKLETLITPYEWGRVILGGDWNTDMSKDSPKKTLLLELAKQMKLKVLSPGKTSKSGKSLDYFLVGSELEATGFVMKTTLSDHSPVKIKVKVPFPRPRIKLILPNRTLAEKITIQNLSFSHNSSSFLYNMEQSLRNLYNEAAKVVKPPKWENKLLHRILESEEIHEVKKIISNYWKEQITANEVARFSVESKQAFHFLKTVYKYDQQVKREGSIINAIIGDDNNIISDPNTVNFELMKTLKDLQLDDNENKYVTPLDFPSLSILEKKDCLKILQKISWGKAISFDLFSDILVSPPFIDQTANILKDLWSINLNSIPDLRKHFKARVIPLNKKHPNLASRFDMRPIIATSPLIKILESRFCEKLQNYLIFHLHPSQTGFIPGSGINVNLVRLLKRLRMKTQNGKHCYALFLGFKSAYNTVRHKKLFEKLSSILNDDEITFLKALYSRITLTLGKEKLVPNVGVAQGSIISPALFNIYTEELLIQLEALNINMEDIFAYADDLLVLCYSLSELHQVINLIKDWSSLNNLKLNTFKSGILEVVPRRGKNNFNLTVGSKFQDFPVISSYKYLGVLINQKLSPKTHLNWLKSRLIYLHNKLSPVLSQVSVNYCHNLWQLLVKPLLDPLAILGSLEVAQCWKEKVERLFKFSLKQFLNLGITTPNETLYYISGYNIHERGEILIQDATKRWEARKSHSKFVKSPLPQFTHRLKYAPTVFQIKFDT